ncbi:hypothetical protein EW146_g1921 [Bondarzewia mesenterica]|uniref:Nucleoside diphosphate kinase n=1 Tax=Bondarzewia mesenterica TaxID=1095465 RepID=A0A4V3XFX2_9AGAM|nr:hypothetical protein EW146_g1921 [Bondarzewia mesenterica]
MEEQANLLPDDSPRRNPRLRTTSLTSSQASRLTQSTSAYHLRNPTLRERTSSTSIRMHEQHILAPIPLRHSALQTPDLSSPRWAQTPSPSSSRAISPAVSYRQHLHFGTLMDAKERLGHDRDGEQRDSGGMGRRWLRWMHRHGMRDWVLLCAVLGSALVKWSVGLGTYSGQGTPPMFGDYEAQRHWMEITTHLPIWQWYTYDLQYWGLDYPPLTAYVSWLCGIIGSLIDTSWFALDKSRGIETESSKVFMRATVLVLDYIVYVPALWMFYNSVMLGFTLLAINCFIAGRDLLGAFFFVCSLGFKQMALYYAPAIGSYLIGKCLYLGPQNGLQLFVRLAIVTLASFLLLFLPFLPPFAPLSSILDPISRIFPFNRGIFEDKVANFWCASNVVLKWRSCASRSTLVRLSTVFTAVGFLPAAVAPVRAWLQLGEEMSTDSANKVGKIATVPPVIQPVLLHALLSSAMSFFLFSFQVHEKTILLPLLPLTLLQVGAAQDSIAFKMGTLVNNVAIFSMWPLLKRDGQAIQYLALTLLWNRFIGHNPFRIQKPTYFDLFAVTVYMACLSLHSLELLFSPPARYPDLFPVLNVLISTPIFVLTWLWSMKSLIEAGWAVGVLGMGSRSRRASVSDKGHSGEQALATQDGISPMATSSGMGREFGMRAHSLGQTISSSVSQPPPPPPGAVKHPTTKPRTRLSPAPRPVVSHRHQPYPHLPPNFGQNQLLPVSNSTRALLESIVADFEAPIRYAFAYGSGVFEQDGYTPDPKGPMLDFMFAVTHPSHFHSINMNQHPSHYALHARLFGSSFVSSVQEMGPGVWFNAYVQTKGVTIKYGVTTVDNLCSDLLNWNSLYLAGRMHKPLRIIKDDPRVRLTQQVNLTSAVRASLLMLPAEFSETQLFETIAGISYSGDPRMILPAENHGKVGNIVRAQGPQFRELYHRLVVGLPGVYWPGHLTTIKQDTSAHARAAHLKKLPSNLLAHVKESYGSSLPSIEADETAYWTRVAGDEKLPSVIRDQMSGIVRSPATIQTLKGIVSGGIGTTIRYSAEKLVALSFPLSFMSQLSPESPNASYEEAPVQSLVKSPPRSPLVNPTRTVAIIKPHALEHRFDIEHRITTAGFEIVKERQMEFDVENDPDILFELFGEDASSFAEGPVWVYVLERHRAVEVWNTIMGDPDPEVARISSSTSLRALYGISREQNATMGSPDVQTAEVQIASLFVSSPPFPTTELPDDLDFVSPVSNGSIRSVSSSVLSALRRGAPSDGSRTHGGSSISRSNEDSGNVTPNFKARSIPSSHVSPTIVPRTTRAADLRAGIISGTPERDRRHRTPPSKEQLAKMFANVPGHKRTGTITVASTAPPAVAPRMTRAASLRLGQTPVVLARPKTTANSGDKKIFEGVPGHKRRESIAVASTKAPTVSPRLNKSATLRVQKDAAPPSSFMFRAASSQQTPSLSRASSRTQLSSRPASVQSVIPPTRRASSVAGSNAPKPAARSPAPPADRPKKPRPSSLQAPLMPPRQNKSAMLRAAKMNAGTTPAGVNGKAGPAIKPKLAVKAVKAI